MPELTKPDKDVQEQTDIIQDGKLLGTSGPLVEGKTLDLKINIPPQPIGDPKGRPTEELPGIGIESQEPEPFDTVLEDDLLEEFQQREIDEILETLNLSKDDQGNIVSKPPQRDSGIFNPSPASSQETAPTTQEQLQPFAEDPLDKFPAFRKLEPTPGEKTLQNFEQITVGPFTDAAVNTLSLISEQGQNLRDLEIGDTTVQRLLDEVGLGGQIPVEIEKLPASDSPGIQMIRGLLAFAAGFALTRKFTGAGNITAGATSDLLAVDRDQNLSNLFNNLAPELKNPITDFLESKIDDSELEKALKNVLEGGLVGITFGIPKFVKGLVKLAKQIKESGLAERLIKEETGSIDPEFFKNLFKDEKGAVGPDINKEDIGGGREGGGSFGNPGEGIPQGIRQYVRTSGRVMDIGDNISINFNRSALPEEVKRTHAGFRQLSDVSDQIKKEVGPPRTLEEVEKEAVDRFNKNPQGEYERFVTSDLRQGFTDVDMTIARMIRDQSAARLFILKEATLQKVRGAGTLLRDHLATHVIITSKEQLMSAEASRLLGSRRIITGNLGNRLFADKVDDLVNELPPNIDDFTLAVRLDALETPDQLEEFAKTYARPGFGKMFLEAWLAGLLSSPKTHAANMVSNLLTNLGHFFVETPIAAVIGRARGTVDPIRLMEVRAALFAIDQTLKEAWTLSVKAFRTGEPQSEFTKIEGLREPALTSENVEAAFKGLKDEIGFAGFIGKVGPKKIEKSGPLGRTIDAIGTIYRIPLKLLMAEDEFFKVFAYRMKLNALAYRNAVNRGLEGKELADEIIRLRNNPPPSLKIEATDTAAYLTFTKPLGEAGQKFTEFVDAAPILRITFPFIRTPVNLAKYTFERLPILRRRLGEVREDIKAGGARRDTQLARLLMGGAFIYTAAQMAVSGMISGSGPVGPGSGALRETLRRDGWKPNSIIVEDNDGKKHYYSFNRLDGGLGTILGLVADYKLIASVADENTTERAFLALQIALARQILSRNYARGLRQVLNSILNPERSDAAYWDNLFKTVVPRLSAHMAGQLDPVFRETRGLYDEIMASIPGLSEKLPPSLDLWGNIKTRDGAWGPDFFSPIETSTQKNDEVDQELIQQGFGLRRPSRLFRSQGTVVELTPEQHNRLILLTGKEEKNPEGDNLKQALRKIIKTDAYQKATDGPGGGKELIVKDIYNGYLAQARNSLLIEFPSLQDTIDEMVQRREEKQFGNESVGPKPLFDIPTKSKADNNPQKPLPIKVR